MSKLPPPWDPFDDADEQYRRASGLDPSRPSEATRRAVLSHAQQVAAARARRGALRRWLSASGSALRWRPAIVGTAAVAVLAGVLVAPQFLPPNTPRPSLESKGTPVTTPPPAALQEVTVTGSHREQALNPAQPGPAERAPRMTLQRPRVPANVAPAPPPDVTAAKSANDMMAGDLGGGAESVTEQRTYASAARAVAPVVASPGVTRMSPSTSAGALRQAAAGGDVAALTAQLASVGSDIDARDAQGRTALMLATLNGKADAVELLLARGADPNAADAHGVTSLQAADAAGEAEISSALRRYGAR